MEKKTVEQNLNSKDSKPHESGSVSVQGHVKIFDPQTKEVFVNKRS
jgi:hypothetical protein